MKLVEATTSGDLYNSGTLISAHDVVKHTLRVIDAGNVGDLPGHITAR
jgi:hypothetical protein